MWGTVWLVVGVERCRCIACVGCFVRASGPFFAWGFGGERARLRLGVAFEAWDGGLRGLFAFLTCRGDSNGW